MKFKVLNKNTFIVYLNSFYKKIDSNSKEIIKSIIILIKKRYAYNIYGYYEVNIYRINNLLSILLFNRLDNDMLLYNSIDLKIIEKNSKIKYKIDDFTIIEDDKELNDNDIYKICEHYSIDDVNLHR